MIETQLRPSVHGPADDDQRRRRSHDGDALKTDQANDARVAILGLLYVGLPLALAFVQAGLAVQGIDASPERVADLLDGRSPIDDVGDDRLRAALLDGLSIRSTMQAGLGDVDAIIVCVPTPITASKDPDLGPVLAAARSIRASIRRGQLVILQSTTFPGTTTGPFRSIIEESGLRAGIDFDLAFAPERVSPGDPTSAGRAVPRLVGGLGPAATRRAARLLRQVNEEVIELSSPDAAELAKLLENTFRMVNIAFVNEIALLCERLELDVWEVVDAAATKPFGFMKFTPGPGVGGHCIPVDPHYLTWRARSFDLMDRFVDVATAINEAMPQHVIELVMDGLRDRGRTLDGARVGVLGVAFKPNVRDARNSPAGEVIARLAERGAEVRYHDPHVPSFRDVAGDRRESVRLDDLLDWSDAVVIVTPHAAIEWDLVYAGAELIIDTVDASRGRTTRSRQVLRLGAGWSTRA